MPPPMNLMTVTEAAEHLGLTRRVIQRRIKTGKIPAVKLPGTTGSYLIDPAIIEYMAIEQVARRTRRATREARAAARATPGTAA